MIPVSHDILEIRGLRVSVKSKNIIEGVTFSVRRGQVVGVLGPNGAGKSTVLHSITGIMPYEGSILVDGHDARSVPAKKRFGFAPDDLPWPNNLTGYEMLALHKRLRGDAFDGKLASTIADVLDLAPHLGRLVGEYSHGMRRKLQFICAITHHPELLILDEPLRGLDPEAALILHTLLAEQRASGRAVLVATHDLAAAERYCDHVVIISSGSIVAQGAPDQLLSQHQGTNLEQVFMEATGLATTMQSRSEVVKEAFQQSSNKGNK